MCAATPAGEAVAGNGALLRMRALRFHARATKRTDSRAALDVHKRVLMVVVGKLSDAAEQQLSAFTQRKFGATRSELPHLQAWLQDQGVEEVVLESTARSWKPGWLALEELFRLRLAQACSNRAPRGRKTGFQDTQRLARRHLAGELTRSFVPDAEQRLMRPLMRRRAQLTRDRVRIQNQVESLLEGTRIKLSSVLSELFGGTGLRSLAALAQGESGPLR